jgi:D-glycero-alpha-D-manno-heptose-7-phosphate kinase
MKMVIVRAPLRLSFVGGGSDIPPGPGGTISTSIDQYVYCIARTRRDKKFYLSWKEKEVASDVDSIKHSIVREVVRFLGFDGGLEICFIADVPASGSGLGSSAATCISLIHALLLIKGFHRDEIDKEWVASTACHIQISILGNSQGYQDEYTSAFGGLLRMHYSAVAGKICAVKYDRIFISEAQKKLMNSQFILFSPKSESGRRAEEILNSYEISSSFREECIKMCDMFTLALKSGLLESLGPLIYQHHALKCGLTTLFAPSVKLHDINYKLCGAGNTGHLLVHCSMGERAMVKTIVEEAWGPELPFKLTETGSEMIYGEE